MSFNIQGKVRISQNLAKFADIPGEAIEQGLKYVAVEVPKRSKARLSALGYVKTGKTLRSIEGSAKGDKATIRAGGPGAEQATILEYGAKPKPHIIRPKLQKSLFWAGAPFPMKVIHHPGHRIREGRFLRGPAEDMANSSELESVFSRAVKEVHEKLVK